MKPAGGRLLLWRSARSSSCAPWPSPPSSCPRPPCLTAPGLPRGTRASSPAISSGVSFPRPAAWKSSGLRLFVKESSAFAGTALERPRTSSEARYHAVDETVNACVDPGATKKSPAPTHMIRALIFDFDGLILDTETALIRRLRGCPRRPRPALRPASFHAERRARRLRLRPLEGLRRRGRPGGASRTRGSSSRRPGSRRSRSCPGLHGAHGRGEVRGPPDRPGIQFRP